jgi:formylglycine-generating enzyme required for sulfatase activity
VSAQGIGVLSYQWLRDGVAVSGGTASELPLKNLQTGTYTVEVRNGLSTTTSGSVTVSGPRFPEDFVLASAGKLPSSSDLGPVDVSGFCIGKTEVTLAQWQQVRAWAAANGYTDLGDKGSGLGDTFPVTGVNWYDALKWCNARSEMDGRTPVYLSNNAIYKSGQAVPSVDLLANGYRLPTEAEWEFAARGGVQTKGYTYSGSNNLGSVAWYASNADYKTNAVAGKLANELGLFDMSGNVWEWCFSLFKAASTDRVNRGGSWFTTQDGCAVKFRKEQSPDSRLNYIGFRVALNQHP